MFQGMFRERRRTSAVRGTGLLHTPAEPGFNRFVDAAARAFNAPIALLSLISGQQQWFKATHGLEIDCIDRDEGFCSFTLDRSGLLEICDPQSDPDFASLPVVAGAPHVRYYIGAPLRLLSGVDVGALCVLDTVPRQPASGDQKAYLLGLARQASLALEARLDLVGDAA
ncbi:MULTISPECIES: GAF domain-containing protein [unclassified Sphingomonas]|uniref:GAF domain-containing protein n=1 Tax=unclassified Sphingomonas TaxID=196159 RepID=UPI00226AD512|nr:MULTISPECIES: GAF domain-containing protein [unclassified Sphingomonas]